MYNKLFIRFFYTCNFKPVVTGHTPLNLYSFKKLRNNNHVMCRNFFIFLFFINKDLRSDNNLSFSVFLRPNRRSNNTILRAPYRYKLARYQITTSKYNVIVTSKIRYPFKDITTLSEVIDFVFLNKKFYSCFESNMIFQNKVRLSFNTRFSNFFKINNYKQ